VRRIVLAGALVAALAALALPSQAAAHPLGNFTINRSAALDVSGNALYVSYVLDLAEIPTFQDRQSGVGAADYLRRVERGLRVSVGGRPVTLRPVAHRLAHPKGQGGLDTTRFEVVLAGPALHGTQSVHLDDRTYGSRIGWKEVVVQTRAGARIVSATAPATSQTDFLRRYPKSLLHSPLDVTTADATLTAGSSPGPVPALASFSSLAAPDRLADGGFTSLISRGRLSVGVILVSLLVAAFWGAVHALTPCCSAPRSR
jgi:nickel/cobalt transporter (NicO) family protein